MKETSTSGLPPYFLCSSTVSFPPENACLLICDKWIQVRQVRKRMNLCKILSKLFGAPCFWSALVCQWGRWRSSCRWRSSSSAPPAGQGRRWSAAGLVLDGRSLEQRHVSSWSTGPGWATGQKGSRLADYQHCCVLIYRLLLLSLPGLWHKGWGTVRLFCLQKSEGKSCWRMELPGWPGSWSFLKEWVNLMNDKWVQRDSESAGPENDQWSPAELHSHMGSTTGWKTQSVLPMQSLSVKPKMPLTWLNVTCFWTFTTFL